MLARRQEGTVLQLTIAPHEKELEARQGKLDTQAIQETETEPEALRRIESNPADGILREATESETSLIIMG
jgi:Trk K+ transport system NAD-binding subunit